MINRARAVGALAAVALATTATITVPDFYGNIARNQFVEYARTTTGRERLMNTVKKLRASPESDFNRIVNLEWSLSSAETTSINGAKECPILAPMCIDSVAKTFNHYREGYRGI